MSNSEPVPDPGQTPPPTGRPSRALLIVLALILTLVAVALVVVFTRGQPAALAADTPDGVVQRYASAVLEGDDTAAGAYLSARTLATCDSAAAPGSESTRVTLIDVREQERTAVVRVSITTSTDSTAFGSSEYESQDVFTLVKADGDWLIEQAPWQLTVCPAPADGTNP